MKKYKQRKLSKIEYKCSNCNFSAVYDKPRISPVKCINCKSTYLEFIKRV